MFLSAVSLTQINNPAVAIIDGRKWDNNLYASATGYRFRAVRGPDSVHRRHDRCASSSRPKMGSAHTWTSVVDIFYDRLVLGVKSDTGLAFRKAQSAPRHSLPVRLFPMARRRS